MNCKKTSTLILLFLLVATLTVSFFEVKATTTPIWSGETRLNTLDRVEYQWDPFPPPGHNITVYYQYEDSNPSITATKDNKIWVAWDLTDPNLPDNPEIYYMTYFISNGSWTNGTQLTFDASIDTEPAILQTADNKIWIFWASNRNSNYDIFYTTTTNEGASWSTPNNATSDLRDDRNPSVAQTNDGKIWLAWSRQTTSNTVDILYKTFDGSTWTEYPPLTTNQNRNYAPSIMQAKDGKIWVFWFRVNADGSEHIYYRYLSGAVWSSEAALTTIAINKDPAAFVEKDGTMRVFWASKERPNADFEIFYKASYDNGSTWSSTPVQFSSDLEEDYQPSGVQAPDKSMWVVWVSTRDDPWGNPNIDLYFRYSYVGDVDGDKNSDGIADGAPDGKIDIWDLSAIATSMPSNPSSLGNDPPGQAAPPWEWGEWRHDCDLNVDNQINVIDLAIAGTNYGRQA